MSKVLGKHRGPLLGVVAALLVAIAMLQGAAPDWWTTRGIFTSGAAASDHSPATQGQLKNFARAAMEEMGAQPGSPTYDLVAAWRANKTQAQDHAVATIGQVKAVAKPFYDQLGLAYPWTTTTSDDADHAPATVGQLKAVFNFAVNPTPTPTPTPTPEPTLDSDGDGMLDAWETSHGLDPNDPLDRDLDPDNDGFSNFEEHEAGTDPQDDGSRPPDMAGELPLRLGYWRFPAGVSDYGSEGQTPLSQTSREVEVSPWGSSLKVPLTGDSLLTYRDVEPNGNSNIDLQRGSVRVWIKPNWNSTAGGVPGGPGSWARVLEFGGWTGDASYGFWSIHFDPDGTYLWISTQNELGQSSGFPTPTFSWQAGEWHQLAVTYTSTQTKFYIDGVLVGSGNGLTALPNATVRAAGFSIGTDRYSTQRTNANLAELETFNYELPAAEIASQYQLTKPDPNAGGSPSLVDTDGDGLPDSYQTGLGGQGASGDNDADGLSNLTEYLADTDPLTSDGMGAVFVATGLKVYTSLEK